MFLVALMLFAPLAAASSVSTFATGELSVDVELRDGSEYLNTIDGEVDLPAGETVTGASLKIATKMIEHSSNARIDVDTIPRVWNPQYNNQLTIFSNIDDFQIEDGSQATPVSLKSEGFLTDFEGTNAGFTDMTMPPPTNGMGWNMVHYLVTLSQIQTVLQELIAGGQIFMTITTLMIMLTNHLI